MVLVIAATGSKLLLITIAHNLMTLVHSLMVVDPRSSTPIVKGWHDGGLFHDTKFILPCAPTVPVTSVRHCFHDRASKNEACSFLADKVWWCIRRAADPFPPGSISQVLADRM